MLPYIRSQQQVILTYCLPIAAGAVFVPVNSSSTLFFLFDEIIVPPMLQLLLVFSASSYSGVNTSLGQMTNPTVKTSNQD